MVKYFLGDLPPDQEQRLEESFFASDQLFDRLQAVKEKLIDDYLHGALCAEEQTLFEQNFLNSPPQREQVEFARALMHKLSNSS